MKKYVPKVLLEDKNAPPSKKGQPFFIRKEGEKVYTGFPLIPETETDGFIFGAISDFLEPDGPEGCERGDGYVQAPDGSRAGLMWHVGESYISMLDEPNEERWGVYNIFFPKPITSLEDLVYNFKEVLPLLKELYEDRVHYNKKKKFEPKNFYCLCCGYKTLEEEPSGTFEICDICGWEDDMGDGGANQVTLKQAKANFKRYGISDLADVTKFYIRKPSEYDIRHPDWESLYYPKE